MMPTASYPILVVDDDRDNYELLAEALAMTMACLLTEARTRSNYARCAQCESPQQSF